MIWVGTLCWAGCWVRGWPVGTERTAEVGREGRGCTTPPSPCCLPSWRSDPTKYAGRGGAGHCSILCPRSLATWPPCHHRVTPASSGGGCQHHVATYLSPVNVQYIYFIKLWASFVVVIASPFFGKIMTSKRISFIGLQKIIQSDN